MSGELLAVMKKVCREDPSRWSMYMAEVASVHNMSRAVHGFTPFELLYGSAPINLLTIASSREAVLKAGAHMWNCEPSEHVRFLRERLSELQSRADRQQRRVMVEKASLSRKKDWPLYGIGDLVTVERSQTAGKLLSQRRGPYRVVALPTRPSPLTYTVQPLWEPRRRDLVHVNRLTRLHAPRLAERDLRLLAEPGPRYKIERILQKRQRTRNGQVEYKVRWIALW